MHDSPLEEERRSEVDTQQQQRVRRHVFQCLILLPQMFTAVTKKQDIHTAPGTVKSCPRSIANRVAVVLHEPLGHFLFLFFPSLTAHWVNMGRT